jgi:hypothetical protein
MDRLASSANRPEMAMACPAWPSLMRRSAAIGVSRLTGMNSEAIRAKAPSAMAMTAPQAAGRSGAAARFNGISGVMLEWEVMRKHRLRAERCGTAAKTVEDQAASVALSITKRYFTSPLSMRS